MPGQRQADNDRLLMCAENLREGMQLGPIFYLIEATQAAAFAQALAMPYPTPPGEGTIVPATMRLQDYALLIAHHFKGGSGGVHARHHSEFHRPMRVGQTIKTSGTIRRVWRKRGKLYFEIAYESRDAVTDELLVTQAITAIMLRDGAMQ